MQRVYTLCSSQLEPAPKLIFYESDYIVKILLIPPSLNFNHSLNLLATTLLHKDMPSRAETPPTPKRRTSASSDTLPPKSKSKSKSTIMSATAQPFTPKQDRVPASPVENDPANGETSATGAAIAAAVAAARVTKPLPGARRTEERADMVPVQANVPKSNGEKETTRRLIVILSQVRYRIGYGADESRLVSRCIGYHPGRAGRMQVEKRPSTLCSTATITKVS